MKTLIVCFNNIFIYIYKYLLSVFYIAFLADTEKDLEADDEKSDDNNIEGYNSSTVEDETTKNKNLRIAVKNWALKFNINHSALKILFEIINNRFDSNLLPQDPRTLMETPKSVEIVPCGEGKYWHNGLKFCLENVFSNIHNPINISLNVNLDGLPIFKSAKDEFWPILANIHEFPEQKPMVIGIYSGETKPSDLDAYLMPFVNELQIILDEGICVNSHKISVKIRCFICDSPARAFIKGESASHTHYV